MHILFIIGCNEGPSKRYRVFNHIEYLSSQNITAETAHGFEENLKDLNYLSKFTHLNIFRSGYNSTILELIKKCRSLEIPILYDVDDLIFDPSKVNEIDSFRLMSSDDKKIYLDGVNQYESILKHVDFIITSTKYLVNELRRFNKPIFQIPFGLNKRQLEISKTLSYISHDSKSIKFLGFQSGTNTHFKDFQECSTAIGRILDEYEDVFLKVIGPLDIDKILPNHADKIIKVPFLDWNYLPAEISDLYINLASFDPNSSFCKAKSELKYVESALLGVPTIAANIPSFCEAINNGYNGFIAQNEEDWYEKIKTLIENPGQRNQIGLNARNSVKSSFYPSLLGKKLKNIFLQTSAPRALPVNNYDFSVMPSKALSISWIVPQPFEASGGHRNIFRAIRHLSRTGHSCTLYILPDNERFKNGEEIKKFIKNEFFDIEIDNVILGTQEIDNCDVLMSTYWTTAYVSAENKSKTKLQIYFIQDYEPMFFPMGVDYIRAMETYNFGFYPITSGPWPLSMLRERHNIAEGDYFRFPLDKEIYFPIKELEQKKGRPFRIIFFARPDMPRRCYWLGVLGLAELKKVMPEAEVIFYGDKKEKYSNIPFEFINIGMTETINELGNLYRSADVGICFSTTNPSLVPYEMMACGCPVIDLNINGNEINYDNTALLVDPNPISIRNGILEMFENEELREKYMSKASIFLKQFPSEIEMGILINTFITNKFEKLVNTNF
jgi:glycosyltransferase involved in cell wall biosynthesis